MCSLMLLVAFYLPANGQSHTDLDISGLSHFARTELPNTPLVAKPKPLLWGKPHHKTMACSDTISFEQPEITSLKSSVTTIEYEDNYDLDDCGSGTVTRLWIATDQQGYTANTEQVITILPDLEKPTITLPYAYTTINCMGELPKITPKVSDNCTYQDDLVVEIQEKQWGQNIERTYIVADACGNVSSAALTIGLTDNLAPTFSSLTPKKTIKCGETITFDTPIAKDACASVLLTFVDEVSGEACSATHTRTWTATDAAGNSAQVKQMVIVER
jgi:hypothetical protein